MNTIESNHTIAALVAHVVSQCTAIDREERFDAMLDECYSFEKVGGPFEYMTPSRVLKECDPTAYRCGVNDYMDGEDVVELEGETYEGQDVEKAREEFVDGLNVELSELQNELDSERESEESDECETARLEVLIGELEAFISECERYAF